MNTPLNPVSYIVIFSCYGSQFSAKEQKSTCTVLDMMTISFYLSVWIIENSDNRCSDNQEPTVGARLSLIGQLFRTAPSTWEVNMPSEGVHLFQSSLPGHSCLYCMTGNP